MFLGQKKVPTLPDVFSIRCLGCISRLGDIALPLADELVAAGDDLFLCRECPCIRFSEDLLHDLDEMVGDPHRDVRCIFLGSPATVPLM